MKIFHHILIIIFMALALYVVRDDVKSVLNHALVYLEEHQITPRDIISKINPNDNSVNKTGELVITPGALVVPDNFLALSKNVIKLTRTGVIDYTNQNRKDNGSLPPLKENTKLNSSATKKLQDMFAKQYFEHVSPDGVGVADLGSQAQYEYIVIGENLAMGNFKDDKALVEAWMASPGHRANIINKNYTEIGVSVGKGIYEGREIWMGVQHFGLPRSACPKISNELLITIKSYQNQINSMESDLKIRREKIESGVVSEGYTRNEQIDQYNAIVNTFNKLIADLKIKTIEYNNQIRAFNSCISSYTAS